MSTSSPTRAETLWLRPGSSRGIAHWRTTIRPRKKPTQIDASPVTRTGALRRGPWRPRWRAESAGAVRLRSCPKTHADGSARGAECLTLLGQYSARSWEWGRHGRFRRKLPPPPRHRLERNRPRPTCVNFSARGGDNRLAKIPALSQIGFMRTISDQILRLRTPLNWGRRPGETHEKKSYREVTA